MTYGSTTGHGPQKAIINLDDLLNRLTRDPTPRRCSRVCRDNDAALEPKSQRRRSVRELDGTIRIGVVVCLRSEPCRWLYTKIHRVSYELVHSMPEILAKAACMCIIS